MSYFFVVSGDLTVNSNVLLVSNENALDWACFDLLTWTFTCSSLLFAKQHFADFQLSHSQANVSTDEKEEDGEDNPKQPEDDDDLPAKNQDDPDADSASTPSFFYDDVTCFLDQSPWRLSFFVYNHASEQSDLLFQAFLKQDEDSPPLSSTNFRFLHSIWKQNT